ncbi:MAG: hypothetical protein K2Y23_26425 [Cyanobacteria bacterium]|nr:hypothetical protein [Cyanobacteriota bacterium]
MSGVMRRAGRRARGTWRDGRARTLIAAARLTRATRLAMVGAGVAAPEIMIVECRKGPDVSGLFSEVAAVIGALDHFDRWRGRYAGIRVNFDDGLYYDGSVGPNWWTYYFEPIDVGEAAAPARVVDPHYHDLCAYRVERSMPRPRAAALVQRFVRPAPHVLHIAAAVMQAEWAGRHVVGVHYRGTDKWEDAPRVPYAAAASAIDEAAGSARDWLVFVATDEQPFLEYIRARFPGRVCARPMFRATDGRPIDVTNDDGNYQKGLDAVVDCVLLSRTNALVRTASNLSLCASFFNPMLPQRLLNRER